MKDSASAPANFRTSNAELGDFSGVAFLTECGKAMVAPVICFKIIANSIVAKLLVPWTMDCEMMMVRESDDSMHGLRGKTTRSDQEHHPGCVRRANAFQQYVGTLPSRSVRR